MAKLELSEILLISLDNYRDSILNFANISHKKAYGYKCSVSFCPNRYCRIGDTIPYAFILLQLDPKVEHIAFEPVVRIRKLSKFKLS